MKRKFNCLIALVFMLASCTNSNNKIEKEPKMIKVDTFYLDPMDTTAGKEFNPNNYIKKE